MPRKRKVPIVDEEKENEIEQSQNSTIHNGPMYTIMSNVQLNETFHKKYIRELQQLYSKMDHEAFMYMFIKMIMSAMEGDETNEYAYTTLLFCAKFIAAYDIGDTHPVLVDTCRWLLSTISQNPHIRFRLCQFVNMILNALGVEAALDDAICDSILEYMLRRLRDINPNVRVQAILALQRLQCPDNPDDIVLRVYQFHLCSDPSPRVRQAVITSMGRNYNTISYILDRLWDIDEKVRRHTYLHMSGYPVKAYKVSQRLQLLEQGLNDRSEMVKKVVTTIMLPQWLESYNKNYITFVSALKLDSSEAEVERFIKIAKVAMRAIFKRQKNEDLVACVPLEEDGEFHKCVPHDKLTMEVTLYWQCLIEHLQAEMADELDMIIPELSTFCAYVLRYCESQKVAVDKFVKMEFQYILLSLCEILYLYDLGDEIGRENLKKLICTVLKSNDLEEKIIEVIVKCTENLITDQNSRLQFFVEIIEEITHTSSFKDDLLMNDRTLIEELLEKHPDKDLKLKLSSLKVKILDLEEQEMNYVEKKDYVQAHRITEEKNGYTEEYTNLLKPLLEKHSMSVDSSSERSTSASPCFQNTKKVTPETILKSLQLAFHMVVSKNVRTLTPNVCKLYNEFIGRHIASNQIAIRDWALKCGTAYSMLYEPLAKEIYEVLYAQFFKNHNIRIWKTSITCIFELLDRYGCSSFNVEERENKRKRNGRQLYTTLEYLDDGDDSSVWTSGQAVDIIFMMSHFLDTCDDVCIISAIINGFCRLVLHDHIKSADIIEKLLLRYFNPSTDPEINQILGVFLENLIQRKKQEYLHPSLLPTVSQVISAPYESPLHDIKPETILRFVIDATRPEFCAPGANIHNKLALSFLQEMHNNIANKELCKILLKELLTMEIAVQDDLPMKEKLKEIAEKLIQCEFDSKTLKNIADFKDILDGVFKPALRHVNIDGSDEECKSDDDTVSAITTDRECEKAASNETASERLAPVFEEDKEAEEASVLDKEKEKEKEAEQADKSSEKSNTAKKKEPTKNKESESKNDSGKNKQSDNATSKSNENGREQLALTVSIAAPTTPVNTHHLPTTPTTFGRENSTGLRYLRKSMNSSRNQSHDRGPSPKIRIEARIDSIPNITPPKVQTTNEKVRPTRRNQRAVAKSVATVEEADEQPTSSQRQSTRKLRTASEKRPTSKVRAQKLKEKEKDRGTTTADDSDESESEVIPPSPTAVPDVSAAARPLKRVNRTLRYNATQTSRTATLQETKTTRSNRNNNSTNTTTLGTVESQRPSEISIRNHRKRTMSPRNTNSSTEGENDCASPLRKQSKTSVNLSETSRNIVTQNNKSTAMPAAANTSKQQTTPITNRLRAKNSNVPEQVQKSVPRQKSTRLAAKKTNSPSSKENEPKSPASKSPVSSTSDSSTSSDDEEESTSMNTPTNKRQLSNFTATKSVEKRMTNSRNPVLTLQRANTSSSTSRISTRNSARKDRQRNMIMTRKRLSLEAVQSSPKALTNKITGQKKSTTVAVVKSSKIPVNVALRSNKSNLTAKTQSTKSTDSEETTSSSSSNTDDDDRDYSSTGNNRRKSPLSKASVRPANSLSMSQRAKSTVKASRIARITRNTDAKTIMRKRKI